MATRAADTAGMRIRARRPAASAPEPRATLMPGVQDLLLQRMASVVLGSGVGVVRGRAARGPRWANDAFLAMSGYAAEDLHGLAWSSLAPGALPPLAEPGAVAQAYEAEFVRRDGSRWPVIVSRGVDPIDTAQLILFVFDLTASRVAEAARRAADSQYARFFEVSNVVFWTADAEGRATLSSATTADRLGSEIELDTTAAQAELVHPEDRALAAATWEGAIVSGQAYDIELRTRGLDGGDFRWTRLRAFPDRIGGEVVGWYGITEDIHERRLVTDALLESEQRFKRLADDIPVMVWLTGLDLNATYLSKTWYDFTGQSETEALGQGWLAAVKRADLPRLARLAEDFLAARSFDIDFRVRGRDGAFRWMLSSGRPRFDPSGQLIGYAGALTDIHARKVAERELEATKLRLSRALDGTGVGVWEWDAATDSVTVSGSALGISGIDSRAEYNEVDYRRAIHPEDRPMMLAAMNAYIEGEIDEFKVEIRIRRNQGGWIWVLDRGTATARDERGRATHMVGTLTNIDDSKCAEERLRWTVDHDALTGVASRSLYHRRLEQALAAGGPVALALLDIDAFKAVNDELGHAAGDALLLVLAERLSAFARPEDTVARLGGDEFTLILPGCADVGLLAARLETLRTLLAQPFVHDGKTLTCRSSIGVALAPAHADDASALLKCADLAMYRAKAAGSAEVVVYDPVLGAGRKVSTDAVADLRAALAAGRTAVWYEPIVRLADDAVVAFEAMPSIANGIIDIHELDADAADGELLTQLGDRVVDQVLADFAAWRSAGRAPSFMTVNVALAELRRSDYAPRLLAKLAARDIAPATLRLEIVEAGLYTGRSSGAADATLAALSAGGVFLGLDKFGTGASSLSHVAQLPLVAVKIDRQFIKRTTESVRDRAIARAIIGLADSLGLRSCAVGVETSEQARFFAENGCTYAQGPLFGPPGPV